MNGKDVLGIVFANADDEVIGEITGVRSMASVPFGGDYRLIDFSLSNMVNAGMTKVGIITNNNYQSLMDHLGTGKPWDLARKNEGILLLPPFNAEAAKSYGESRIGAIRNNMHFLEKSKEDYVFMTDPTYVANFDLTELFDFHEKNVFDITQLYIHGRVPALKDNPVLEEIRDGRITKMRISKDGGKEADVALKALFMKKSLLEGLIGLTFSKGFSSFEKDIVLRSINKLKIGAFEVKGFCRIIDSLISYSQANFALLEPENYKQLFCSPRRVYTKVYDDMPTVYGLSSRAVNSLVADGCMIEGSVENSILFRNCRVEKGASVKNSILMPHGFVSQSAELNFCITDKNVSVSSRKSLSGADTYPVFIGKNIHI